MRRTSWKTTTAGATLIACVLTAIAAQADAFPPAWKPWLTLAGAVGMGLSGGLGLIFARDNGVSSQDVGVRK